MHSSESAADFRLFRTFVTDVSARPICGAADCMLGARIGIDIKPNHEGQVHPGTGGMSVTPRDPSLLPPHLRPVSLGGESTLPVFSIAASQLGARLRYQAAKRRPDRHGFVEPSETMQLADYQAALADTAARWEPWQKEVA